MNWDLINNAAYLAIDQPAAKLKNQTALIWVGEKKQEQSFSYSEIQKLTNQFSTYLLKLGIRKGDRVFFFLPRLPFVYYGFLGTLKTGAIGGILFSAFGTQALSDRLNNSGAKVLFTTKELYPRVVPIYKKLKKLKKIVIVNEQLISEIKNQTPMTKNRITQPLDPAFMLYTSATGYTPVSGIVIPHQAIIQQLASARLVLDLKVGDHYWCTADPGWVTGVVYGILTPWGCGVTQFIYEGRFSADFWLECIKKYRLNVIYTAPTALRMIQKVIKQPPQQWPHLRRIACVGEALPPDLFSWTKRFFKKPVQDTYWQTETGSMMIANRPGLKNKKGSMGKPLPGIIAEIVDNQGREVKRGAVGNLVFKPPWPSMMVDIWQNRLLFKSYFKKGWFFTGDRAYQDKGGYFWFIGRKSEIIKTAGERVGTFEVESVINQNPAVLESAIIGKPDKIRGEIIKAYIVLKRGYEPSELLSEEIKNFVKKHLAGHAYPREIEFRDNLPKNRSGKIMRRLLKNQELGIGPGDTSTLDES